MKRVFLPVLLSLAMLAPAPYASADNDSRRGHDRREQRDNHRRNDKRHDDRHAKDSKKHKKDKKNHRYDRHDNHCYGRPTPPPPPPHKVYHNPRPHHSYYRPAPPPGLTPIIHRCCPGGRYLRVWEVNPGVYMLRYMLGGIWYMQEVYPSRHAYGRRMKVYQRDNYWYGDNGYRYYDDDGGLRISVDGRFLNNGIVMPGIYLNINL